MKHLGLGSALGSSILTSGAWVLLATQPAFAQATQVTNVRLNPSGQGVDVILETRDGDRPQIFTVSQGNTLVADVVNTQLALQDGNGFLQNSPAPGISSVVVSQLDANSVRVTVTGDAEAPSGQISQGNEGVVLSVSPAEQGSVAQQPSPATSEAANTDSQTVAQRQPVAQTPDDVLVPDPQIEIDGVPIPAPTQQNFTPPLQPRAVAPPVGDIAVSLVDTSPPAIDLGTGELVPRLVLRDAPVRDVLSLLARAAGLNVAYIGQDSSQAEDAAAAPDGAASDIRISLDIENEPVQDVFNYVLRISGLDANRTGRTIFVGPSLPNEARQLVTRNLRLNQVPVGTALNFLVGLGAETAVSRQRQVTFVSAIPVETGAEGGATVTEQSAQTFTEERIETQRVDFEDSTPLLRGLQVVGDERTNSVTLVGAPNQVEIATAQLVQLDVRRRQVAINVRIVDVDLLALDRASTSFSFGINDTFVGVGGGRGLTVDFLDPGTNIDRNLVAALELEVENQNAKILTDPTLVVQEGQTAEVQLTEEVITNFEIETTGTGDDRTQTVTVERTPAGLILQVQVDRIDDNGFISLSVAPSISAPAAVEEVELDDNLVEITLLAERRLTSGQVRVRDGQTLILSGIIQDQDRTVVSKVPILGDIPLLGALFRDTDRTNSRQEVIVILTPQILDDSDGSTFGYSYTPQRETQQFLEDRTRPTQED
ncbi:AMIN domain-containing protein [Leptolyngbya sp. FACHB-541]|uniref:AMIN domain-containing protein n=1 Tax=Leptolyngbya sp. FACHB-541 TaxID=2692810 RepID=UPI0032207346